MNALTEAEKIDRVWARITLGLWIAAVVLVGQGVVKWAIAADAAPGLSCSAPSQTSCLGPTGFDPTIAGER